MNVHIAFNYFVQLMYFTVLAKPPRKHIPIKLVKLNDIILYYILAKQPRNIIHFNFKKQNEPSISNLIYSIVKRGGGGGGGGAVL